MAFLAEDRLVSEAFAIRSYPQDTSFAMEIRVCGLVLAAFLLLNSARGQVAEPAEQDRIQACGGLQSEACQVAKGCRFCRSRWGQSQCFSANQVSSLPGGVTLVYFTDALICRCP